MNKRVARVVEAVAKRRLAKPDTPHDPPAQRHMSDRGVEQNRSNIVGLVNVVDCFDSSYERPAQQHCHPQCLLCGEVGSQITLCNRNGIGRMHFARPAERRHFCTCEACGKRDHDDYTHAFHSVQRACNCFDVATIKHHTASTNCRCRPRKDTFRYNR